VLRKLLKYTSYLIALLLLALLIRYTPAHWQIRQLTAPLPDRTEIVTLFNHADRPISISIINTANQAMPEGAKLAFPAYVLRWDNGRTFLIDAGMTQEYAIEFGSFLERIASAEPMQFLNSVAVQLGEFSKSVSGIAMTHLHQDHTDGIRSLCADSKRSIDFYQVHWQAKLQNFTTSDGHDQVTAARCLNKTTLPAGEGLVAVPGYPGLAAYAAAGHTPGSTVYFAAVADKIWILSGDITNDMHSMRDNVPKPLAYSLLLTPESTTRTEELRLWLAELEKEADMSVVVSHDLAATLEAGLPMWADR